MRVPTQAQINRWMHACRTVGSDWEAHKALYAEVFGEAPALPLRPLWYPRMGQPESTHLYQALQERQLPTEPLDAPPEAHPYLALHRWSVQQRAEFWQYVLEERLQVPFHRRPSRILHFPSSDIALPVWLEGAAYNVLDLIFRQPADLPALVYEREEGTVERWTYKELAAEVRQLAATLQAHGVTQLSRIAICMPLRPEAVFLYLAALYLGASVATIPDSLSGEEIAARLEVAQPVLFFVQDVLVREGKVLPLYERLQSYRLPKTIVLPAGSSIRVRLRNTSIPWGTFLEERGEVAEAPAAGPPEREIGLLFSSGTTAQPKAIPWTSLTALKAITDAHFYHDVHSEDVIAWPTNLGWMMGPWLLFAGLAHGACVALYAGSPTSAGFCKFVERQRVSILGVVPSLVRRWIETDAWASADWSGIRLFSSTGEASNPWHMWQLMAKAGYKPILEYCGGTEIGGGYITSTLLHPNAPSQFTAPALGIDFVLLNEAGQPASEGELFLVPPSIGLSQRLLNADHEQVYFADTPSVGAGWVGASGNEIPKVYAGVPMRLRRHGDYMRRLEGGAWVSGGRADDAMNLGGIKVSSTEIERVVGQVAGVGEAAAIAVPPPEGGPDQLVVYVVPQPGHPTDPAYWKPRLAEAIREKLSPLFHLSDVVILSELPRTASNKVMRRLLREKYRERA